MLVDLGSRVEVWHEKRMAWSSAGPSTT